MKIFHLLKKLLGLPRGFRLGSKLGQPSKNKIRMNSVVIKFHELLMQNVNDMFTAFVVSSSVPS